MQSVSVSGWSLVPGVFISSMVCVAILLPGHALAQTAVQTQQLLPPGQNTCQAVTVTDVEPHVYGGELESFDLTLTSDISHSYVGVLAQVGNTAIPLNFISRWAGSPSGTRIHIDTPDIAVGTGTQVNVTLLASLPGGPTCITSISFDATNSGGIATYVPPSTQVPTTGGSSSPSPVSSTTGGGGVGQGSGSKVSAAASSTGASSTMGIVTASVSGSANLFNNVCAGGNAYRLWFILLAIYVVIVAVVVFAEPWFLRDSVLGSTATVLVPLLLLLLFWYFSEACRAASWIPVIACVIAIIGLFLAFREYETLPLLAAPSDR